MATGVRKALSRLMRILGGKKKCYCYHDMIMITGRKIEMITNCYSWKDITFPICPNQGKIDE